MQQLGQEASDLFLLGQKGLISAVLHFRGKLKRIAHIQPGHIIGARAEGAEFENERSLIRMHANTSRPKAKPYPTQGLECAIEQGRRSRQRRSRNAVFDQPARYR